jgi:hypothetical protein
MSWMRLCGLRNSRNGVAASLGNALGRRCDPPERQRPLARRCASSSTTSTPCARATSLRLASWYKPRALRGRCREQRAFATHRSEATRRARLSAPRAASRRLAAEPLSRLSARLAAAGCRGISTAHEAPTCEPTRAPSIGAFLSAPLAGGVVVIVMGAGASPARLRPSRPYPDDRVSRPTWLNAA